MNLNIQLKYKEVKIRILLSLFLTQLTTEKLQSNDAKSLISIYYHFFTKTNEFEWVLLGTTCGDNLYELYDNKKPKRKKKMEKRKRKMTSHRWTWTPKWDRKVSIPQTTSNTHNEHQFSSRRGDDSHIHLQGSLRSHCNYSIQYHYFNPAPYT